MIKGVVGDGIGLFRQAKNEGVETGSSRIRWVEDCRTLEGWIAAVKRRRSDIRGGVEAGGTGVSDGEKAGGGELGVDFVPRRLEGGLRAWE